LHWDLLPDVGEGAILGEAAAIREPPSLERAAVVGEPWRRRANGGQRLSGKE